MQNIKRLLLVGFLGLVVSSTMIEAQIKGKEVELFVERFYLKVFNRKAEVEGLMDWTNKLTTQVYSGADVAKGFILSDEFKSKDTSNSDFITILYKTFFDRDPDKDGFNSWLLNLNKNLTRREVLNGFLYSQEFIRLAHNYGIRAIPEDSIVGSTGDVKNFVKRFYKEVLGRTSDIKGLNSWVNKLNTKQLTASDIAKGFVLSSEFKAKSTTDLEFINILYKAFFNRISDDEGFNYWLSLLETNEISRAKVLEGFLGSDEFIHLADTYDIIAFKGVSKSLLLVHNSYNDDNTSFRIRHTYDKKGNKLTSDFESGISIYTYNTDNQLKKSEDIYYSNDGNISIRTTYKYDNKQLINMDTIKFNVDNIIILRYSVSIIYNNEGNVLKRITKNGNIGTEEERTEEERYVYDDYGNITKIEVKTTGGIGIFNNNHCEEFYYTEDGSLLVLSRHYYSDTFYTSTEYIYDKKGHLLSSNTFNGDLQFPSETYHPFDIKIFYDSLGYANKYIGTDFIRYIASDIKGNPLIDKTIYNVDTADSITYATFQYNQYNNLLNHSINNRIIESNEWIRIIPKQ